MADFPWKAFTDRGAFMATALDGLATATLSAVSSELDNLTNRDTHAIFELLIDDVVTVTPAYLELYMVKTLDGTNYEDAPIIGGTDRNTLIANIPLPAGGGADMIVTSGLIVLPPFKVKFYVGNQANVTLNNTTPTNDLNIYTGRLANT